MGGIVQEGRGVSADEGDLLLENLVLKLLELLEL